jgi:hypothetical protein
MAYKKWGEANGVFRFLSREKLAERLREMGCKDEIRRIDRKKSRAWVGIQLLDKDDLFGCSTENDFGWGEPPENDAEGGDPPECE